MAFGDFVDDWLVRHATLLGIPFQNWVLVAFALMLVAALINISERHSDNE
jgi:hypothetical protein